MSGDKDQNLHDNLPDSGDLRVLYEQGKKEEPSAAIDKYILQAARNAVSEKKVAGTGPFSGSWQIPAALAAVLILAVGVTITMKNISGPGQKQVERFAPSSEIPEPAEPVAEQKAAGKPGPRIETTVKRLRVQPGESAIPPAVRSVAPVSPPAKTEEPGEKAGLLETAPAAEPATTTGNDMQQRSMDLQEQSGEAGKSLTQEKQPTVERWLDSIRELVKQEKLEEAKKQLSDFRRVYPDYTLPEELKRLEK